MKNKKLQELLAEHDDDLEVCIGNDDIHFIEEMEAYYDGLLVRAIVDEEKTCYNIVGAKLISSGRKLKIRSIGLDDMIAMNLDLPIDYSDVPEHSAARYQEYVQSQKDQIEEMKTNHFKDKFIHTLAGKLVHDGALMKRKIDLKIALYYAKKAYEESGLTWRDAAKNRGPLLGKSINDADKHWLDDIYAVEADKKDGVQLVKKDQK